MHAMFQWVLGVWDIMPIGKWLHVQGFWIVRHPEILGKWSESSFSIPANSCGEKIQLIDTWFIADFLLAIEDLCLCMLPACFPEVSCRISEVLYGVTHQWHWFSKTAYSLPISWCDTFLDYLWFALQWAITLISWQIGYTGMQKALRSEFLLLP